MADYNVMLGLELESDAIQKIENKIKNIKCESIKIDISISDDRVLNFIQDLSKANKDLANNLLTVNKIAKNTNEQQEKADKQKLDSAKDLLYVYKWLSTIQKEINVSEIKIAKLDKSSKQFQTLSEQVNKLKASYLSLYKIGLKIDGFDINSNYFNQINASFDKTQRQIESIKAALSDKQSLQKLKKQEQELISLAQEKVKLRTQRTKLNNDTNNHDNELKLLEQQINKIKTAYDNLRNKLKKQLPTEQFEILKKKLEEIYDAEIFSKRRNTSIAADKALKQQKIEQEKQQAEALKQQEQELKEQERKLILLLRQKKDLEFSKTKLESNNPEKHSDEITEIETQIKNVGNSYKELRKKLGEQLPTEQFEILKKKLEEIEKAEDNAKDSAIQRINSADSDKKREQQKIEQEKQQAKQQAEVLKIKSNFDSGNIDSEYSKIESSLRSLNTISKTTEENLNKLSQSYIELKNAIDANNTKEIIETYNQFEDVLKKVNSELKQATQLQKISNSVYELENSKRQFSNEINVWLSQNSNATKKFGSRIKTIQSQLESCNETSLNRLKDEFRDITQEATIAGKTGLNFIDTLKQKGKELASYYTISNSFYKIVDIAKQAYQNVANVDSAMTNLYKVTDNTDAEYSDFFQNAKQNAKDLGVTLTDYITATSEWSKLGYDINASSQLAKVSSIYQNVGEVDSETAVKDIVTALKAYNINVDDAISIVDKFNKLGNEFAVSSSSLGEGLKVSASSLAVAGNDINKSLAMLTGGGEITQDIGELGNGLKTISMRLRGKHTCLHIGKVYMLCCA